MLMNSCMLAYVVFTSSCSSKMRRTTTTLIAFPILASPNSPATWKIVKMYRKLKVKGPVGTHYSPPFRPVWEVLYVFALFKSLLSSILQPSEFWPAERSPRQLEYSLSILFYGIIFKCIKTEDALFTIFKETYHHWCCSSVRGLKRTYWHI